MFGNSNAVRLAKIDSQLDRQDEILDEIQETLKADTHPSRDQHEALVERLKTAETAIKDLEGKYERLLWAIIGAYGLLFVSLIGAGAVIISGIFPFIHPAVH